ncbi:sodium-coupled monocarboxylate transporter [Holotrichia oblita]|uniref:Sodium-coupled monocarboxylate transporter n=1 Tax=Holotrichia oblita TaxID=644536 RepID=A0ACB9TTI7_HOLOL|nr:sodium-coupled monocarboxylate transporter [Holotrichia oblita]
MNEKFGWIDYFFFLLMLLISTGMGIYHGIYKKQQTAADYLLGGKQMAIVPISMSLISSTLVLATIGITIITSLSGFSGLVIFAYYYGCDPLQMKAIRTYDQLLPMYVVEVANFIPGLPGLFISGIFSASLSALSASLNCMAGIIHKDLISGFLSKDTSEITVSRHLKILVVTLGVICTILVYLIERLGSLLPLTLSVAAISGGPLFGLFTAGMLIPKVHTTGALWGGIASVVVTSVIIIGAQVNKFRGTFRYIPLPVSTDACNTTITGFLNETYVRLVNKQNKHFISFQYIYRTRRIADSLKADINKPEQPFFLFRISFFYYTMIGGLIAIIVSVIVSHFTERDKPLNKKCLSPIVRSLIDDDEFTKYHTVEKATELCYKK